MDAKPESLDPEDILSSSLELMYHYQPITLSTAGSQYTYISKTHPSTEDPAKPLLITLHTPDTQPANWALHASSIWMASIYLADHLDHLRLADRIRSSHVLAEGPIRVLELGAAAGLPGILVAKAHKDVLVTVSDYPDEELIRTLSENVRINNASSNCRAVAYAWGSDTSLLLADGVGFDIVLAADTLWNPDFRVLFVNTLSRTLKKSPLARIHLVAGLHTGRYTIQSALNAVQEAGFEIDSILEREVAGQGTRSWSVSRDEDEQERRRWVVWIQLKWKSHEL